MCFMKLFCILDKMKDCFRNLQVVFYTQECIKHLFGYLVFVFHHGILHFTFILPKMACSYEQHNFKRISSNVCKL